jgi:hypothetical protein
MCQIIVLTTDHVQQKMSKFINYQKCNWIIIEYRKAEAKVQLGLSIVDSFWIKI